MNVRLATQVLSESIAKILYEYYPEETHGTAEFCEKMDKFFDILNVRNHSEYIKNRKPFFEPFRSNNDVRFDWLKNIFLKYLADWKTSVINRPGNFTQNACDRMFLSWQTYEGLQITVYSLIEVTQFLLNEGMQFVLSERFNQDVVEEYFGRQRSLGRRSDNPTVQQFGYNANTIRMQRSIAPVTGNTRGAHNQKRKVSWFNVENEALRKKK